MKVKYYIILYLYNLRFGSIPDLLELDHLTVSGDVTFGRGGDVMETNRTLHSLVCFVVSESPGHCDHHRQPRGQD